MKLLVFASCLILCGGLSHAAPAQYRIIPLEPLPGTLASLAFGLNDLGQAVGSSPLDRSGNIGQSRPVVWDSGGTPTEVWSDPQIGGSGMDINNLGVIVGRFGAGAGIPTPGPGVPDGRAFVWDSLSGRRDLGFQQFGSSEAVAINDNGRVAGTSEVVEIEVIDGILTANVTAIRPFVWDSASGIRDLGSLGGNNSFAKDINAQGQVVGSSELPSGSTRAFVWDETGGMRELLTLGQSSTAVAINDVGQVLGYDFGIGAVIWDLNTGMRQDVPGGRDLNTQGQIFGGSIGNPTIFDSKDGTVAAIDVIPDNFDWELEIPFAINDASQIVGYGQLNGASRGFLLTPIPEPRSLVLGGLACLILGMSRRSLKASDFG